MDIPPDMPAKVAQRHYDRLGLYRTDIPAFYGPWFAGRQRRPATPLVRQPLWRRAVACLAAAERRRRRSSCRTKNRTAVRQGFAALEAARLPFVRPVLDHRPAAGHRAVGAGERRRAVADLRRLSDALWTPRRGLALRSHRRLGRNAAGGAARELCPAGGVARRRGRRSGGVVHGALRQVAPQSGGVAWRDPRGREAGLVAELAGIARPWHEAHGLQPAWPRRELARCIDAERLGDVAGRPIAARTKGNRPIALRRKPRHRRLRQLRHGLRLLLRCSRPRPRASGAAITIRAEKL